MIKVLKDLKSVDLLSIPLKNYEYLSFAYTFLQSFQSTKYKVSKNAEYGFNNN
jgi:hypothetical protein